RIVLADDHKLFRDGVKKLLDQESDITIVGEASDGEEALAVVQEKKPDVLLFDINMPRMDGIQLIPELNNLMKNIRYVAVSAYDDEDHLAALSAIQAQQGINPRSVEEADVFAIHQDGGYSCVEVFFFRTGQNWGNRAYFPRADKSLEAAEVLGAFLAQFYDDKPVPRLVLVSHEIEERELLEEALTSRAGRKVEVRAPVRGEKKALVDHAMTNAREALGRRLAEGSTQVRLLAGLAEAFGLDEPPARIEVYDNSHVMGTNAVGAMVVAGPEGFAKKEYRKFNIRSADLVPGDDYGMMREVMTRRFSRLMREGVPRDATSGDGMPAWPDLVLVDGGLGQLNAVAAALAEIGIDDVPLVGIAKGPDRDAGREKFFIEGRPSFMLPERDPVLYYVQRLRDEAHRFAIGSHRARRSRELVKNPLDEIDGIGPARKRALLAHFGTAKAVSRAGLADLQAVPGISEATARLVYDHFHESAE
ncbi:MAG TPA: response regulator, partial [Hyphomicrobiales bacterium]|nr:response regulator [Hyphomicrobiales bacterium]